VGGAWASTGGAIADAVRNMAKRAAPERNDHALIMASAGGLSDRACPGSNLGRMRVVVK
jgi:hypothetical protein